MEASERGMGLEAGASCVQVVPFQVQVSFTRGCRPGRHRHRRAPFGWSQSHEPSRRKKRADGLVAGDNCVQVVPFQVQVSPRKVLLPLSPLKRIKDPVTGS